MCRTTCNRTTRLKTTCVRITCDRTACVRTTCDRITRLKTACVRITCSRITRVRTMRMGLCVLEQSVIGLRVLELHV